jgi:hypothetical protein
MQRIIEIRFAGYTAYLKHSASGVRTIAPDVCDAMAERLLAQAIRQAVGVRPSYSGRGWWGIELARLDPKSQARSRGSSGGCSGRSSTASRASQQPSATQDPLWNQIPPPRRSLRSQTRRRSFFAFARRSIGCSGGAPDSSAKTRKSSQEHAGGGRYRPSSCASACAPAASLNSSATRAAQAARRRSPLRQK